MTGKTTEVINLIDIHLRKRNSQTEDTVGVSHLNNTLTPIHFSDTAHKVPNQTIFHL